MKIMVGFDWNGTVRSDLGGGHRYKQAWVYIETELTGGFWQRYTGTCTPDIQVEQHEVPAQIQLYVELLR